MLDAIAPTVNYVGDNGQAVLMKIAVNLNLQVQLMAFCEACCSPRRAAFRARRR